MFAKTVVKGAVLYAWDLESIDLYCLGFWKWNIYYLPSSGTQCHYLGKRKKVDHGFLTLAAYMQCHIFLNFQWYIYTVLQLTIAMVIFEDLYSLLFI